MFPSWANARDLGGLRAAGGAVVRSGRLWRGGRMACLTAADAAALGRLGLVTVVDLRSDAEVAADPPSPLAATAIRVVREPLDRGQRPVEALDRLYLATLREAGGTVANVLRLLTVDAVYPAAICCSAGRDRTGLVVAVLLGILGVAGDEIVAEYALSKSDPEVMASCLRGLADEHGSADGYALAAGLTPADLAALRERLLEPVR
jgi:protein tyrosine/serine phosphatase